jgi:hypothetical protein
MLQLFGDSLLLQLGCVCSACDCACFCRKAAVHSCWHALRAGCCLAVECCISVLFSVSRVRVRVVFSAGKAWQHHAQCYGATGYASHVVDTTTTWQCSGRRVARGIGCVRRHKACKHSESFSATCNSHHRLCHSCWVTNATMLQTLQLRLLPREHYISSVESFVTGCHKPLSDDSSCATCALSDDSPCTWHAQRCKDKQRC